MKAARVVALAGVLGLAGSGLAGCHGGGSSTAAGPEPASSTAQATSAAAATTAATAALKLPAPCSLISAAEASASLGYGVTSMDSSADNDPDQISCLYLKGKDPVMVVLIRDWTLAKFTADAAKEPGPPKPLSGIGTAAYFGANEKGPVVLVWERGVSVLISGVSPVSADQVKFLAKVAVGQLDTPNG